MRYLKFAFALTFSIVGMWYITVSSYEAWTEARHVEATSANESPFFKAYQPDEPIKLFYIPSQRCTSGSSNTANSDRHYVHHGLYWETTCIIRADREQEFVNAIRSEISCSLEATHSRVMFGGDRYKYGSGASVGAITIEPVERLNQPLPVGLENVHIRLKVEEKFNEWW